jgi:hypothetical protein
MLIFGEAVESSLWIDRVFRQQLPLSHAGQIRPIAVLGIGENPGKHHSVSELEDFDFLHSEPSSAREEGFPIQTAVIRVPLAKSICLIRVSRIAVIPDDDVGP